MQPTAAMTARRTRRVSAATALTAAAIAALTAVPTANASCASFFGIGSGGDCTSNLTSIAVAVGQNAQAHADGILGAAWTFGTASTASTTSGALLNLAVTFGNKNTTNAGGIASLALTANSVDQTVLAGEAGALSGNIGNIAVSLDSPATTMTIANGIANATANIAGTGNVYGRGLGLGTLNAVGLGVTLYNSGTLNNITNIAGNNTFASNLEGGVGTVAFNLIGENNAIYTKGPLAVAGTVASTGQTVEQSGPGVKIRFNRRDPGIRRAAARVVAESGPGTTASATAEASTSSRRPHASRGDR